MGFSEYMTVHALLQISSSSRDSHFVDFIALVVQEHLTW